MGNRILEIEKILMLIAKKTKVKADFVNQAKDPKVDVTMEDIDPHPDILGPAE